MGKWQPAVVGAAIGLVVGAAIATGIFLYVGNRDADRRQAMALAAGYARGLARSLSAGKPGTTEGDEEEAKIEELGKDFVADLERNRLASAYRVTSAAFQKRTERKMFDELVGKHPELTDLTSDESDGEHKVRKLADGKGYDYFFTGKQAGAFSGGKLVNVALTFVREGSEWRVEQIEITVMK